MRQQPFAGRQRDVGPGLTHEARCVRCMLPHMAHQFVGLRQPRSRQPVEILHGEEGLHQVVRARLEIMADIAPAIADIDADELEAHEQRHGADLVLRILLPDAPDMLVIEREHLVVGAERDVIEAEMPEIMREHEGVELGPAVLHIIEEIDALADPALREQHMGECVVRSGLLALERDSVPRRSLRLLEEMALLIGEGQHAVHIGQVGIGLADAGRDAQHAR